jgi:hypothetical protein
VTDPVVDQDHEHVYEVDAETENAWRAVLTGELGR